MSLTVSEKNHWKERIARRIDKKVETLLAAEPNLMDRIHHDARQRALQSLGLADWQAELDGIHEDELLGECDTGREILRLRQEQEDLLDTVWLASSPSQLKALWSTVNALLGTTPTQLERDALEIPAVDGE